MVALHLSLGAVRPLVVVLLYGWGLIVALRGDRGRDRVQHSPVSSNEPGLPDDVGRFTEVRSFHNLFAAEFAKSVLEADGIAVVLGNANIGSLGEHFAIATGGISIQVPESEVARANELLDKLDNESVDAIDPNVSPPR